MPFCLHNNFTCFTSIHNNCRRSFYEYINVLLLLIVCDLNSVCTNVEDLNSLFRHFSGE